MKKIKIYLPLFVIIVTTIGLTFDVIIPNVYALTPPYNEQISALYQNNMWQLGKNLDGADLQRANFGNVRNLPITSENARKMGATNI